MGTIFIYLVDIQGKVKEVESSNHIRMGIKAGEKFPTDYTRVFKDF